MNATKTLVTILLIGSVAMGFVHGLSTQSASGVITSMSTMTSTYYSTQYSATVSTQFTTTLVRTVSQESTVGRYLNIKVGIWYWQEKGQTGMEKIVAEGTITNLMNVRAEKVTIVFLFSNRARTLVQETSIDFYDIDVGVSEGFSEKVVPVNKPFQSTDFSWYVVRVEIVCSGITIVVPAATYTFSQTGTSTYVATYVATYTLSDVQTFLSSGGAILLLVVVAGAIVAVFVFMRRKKSAR